VWHTAFRGNHRFVGVPVSGLVLPAASCTISAAVRNLVRAGVPERVAMTMAGHKTRSVFERYNIVSPGDLTEAARNLDSANQRRQEADGHSSGTVSTLRAVSGSPTASQVVEK
jgi:poly(3-hydroxybutyrate) depolymerase